MIDFSTEPTGPNSPARPKRRRKASVLARYRGIVRLAAELSHLARHLALAVHHGLDAGAEAEAVNIFFDAWKAGKLPFHLPRRVRQGIDAGTEAAMERLPGGGS